MIMPPGGFIVLSLLLVAFNWVNQRLDRRVEQSEGCGHGS